MYSREIFAVFKETCVMCCRITVIAKTNNNFMFIKLGYIHVMKYYTAVMSEKILSSKYTEICWNKRANCTIMWMLWYHLCKHTYEYAWNTQWIYICDEVIRTQTEKLLGYKIQDSERRKVNDTGEGIQRNFQVYLWLFFLY